MSDHRSSRARPFYLSGARGPLLAIYYPTQGEPRGFGDVLVAPAFAEEMNRCRAMVAMQSRRFAALGVGTLLVDPYGTGDSGGEFAEATWRQWRDDLAVGLDWLRRQGNGCRSVWGVRLGAIMAAEIAAAQPDIDRLLFWQPVVHGKAFLTQFLRIRVAAELEQSGGIRSTDELRRLAAAGEPIEVSGYRLSPELVQELDQVRLPDAASLGARQLSWFELVTSEESPVPAVNLRELTSYQTAGVRVTFERVRGPSFWQVHERAEAPELLDATTRQLDRWSDVGDLAPAVGAAAPTRVSSVAASRQSSPVIAAEEYPLTFKCEDDELLGIVHRGRREVRRGVIVVVAGGPQYRSGAHRQFVSLARRLAARGYPVLRFDSRGMGDSSGWHRGFQEIGADIAAAINALLVAEPQIEEVTLFGECESASGILFYAFQDRSPSLFIIIICGPH